MDRSSLLDAIRRLMALGNSPNEHEAAAAVAKAAELMQRYHVDAADIPAEPDTFTETEAGQHTRPPAFLNYIGALLSEHFGVLVMQERTPGSRAAKQILFGDSSDVAVAVYVYHFLEFTFADLARKRKIPRNQRRAYWLGLARGLSEKLRAAQAPGPTGHALAINRHAAATAEMERRFPDMRDVRKPPAVKRGYEALQQGEADGRNIEIRPALAAQQQAAAPARLTHQEPAR